MNGRARAFAPIIERVGNPTPEQVRTAREQAGLTQTAAALLVSPARAQPYRTWQSYEVPSGQSGARSIPLATWELFLLLTNQHPGLRLTRRRPAVTAP